MLWVLITSASSRHTNWYPGEKILVIVSLKKCLIWRYESVLIAYANNNDLDLPSEIPDDLLSNSAFFVELHFTLRLFKYIENYTTKKFSDKNSDIFHISAQNIECGNSLQPPQ